MRDGGTTFLYASCADDMEKMACAGMVARGTGGASCLADALAGLRDAKILIEEIERLRREVRGAANPYHGARVVRAREAMIPRPKAAQYARRQWWCSWWRRAGTAI